MLKFGDPFQNILTLAIIFGLGYIIYIKWKGKGGENSIFKGLFSKTKEVADRTDLKGRKLW